jgi:hypothetical protein
MPICNEQEQTVEWKVRISGSGFESSEEALKAAKKLIRDMVEDKVKCKGDDCLDQNKCRPTYDDADRDALIHLFSYPDGDGDESHGYRIKKGSKLNVTCDCVNPR